MGNEDTSARKSKMRRVDSGMQVFSSNDGWLALKPRVMSRGVKMPLRVVLGDAPQSGVRCVLGLLTAIFPVGAVAGDVCDGIVDPHAYNYCLAKQGPVYSGGKTSRAARSAPTMKVFDAPPASFKQPVGSSPAEPTLPGILNMGAGKPGRHKLGGRFLN
jgi:hypothetical protein